MNRRSDDDTPPPPSSFFFFFYRSTRFTWMTYFKVKTANFAERWQVCTPGETSGMHCSGVILVHSSTRSSNLEGSVGLFYELWSLVLIFYWIQVRWLVGHSSNFIFFLWNQLRVSLAVFGIIVTLVSSSSSWYCVGTEPANINFHWWGAGLFLITDRFQMVSWLSMPFCTSLSSRVQYFSLCHSILLHRT